MARTRRPKPLGPVPSSDPDLDDSGKDAAPPAIGGNVSGERLRSFVERIESLEKDRKAIGDDIKEVKAEAKGTGFDVGVINFIVKERKKDKDDLDEFNTQVEIYKRALGMIPEI